MSKKEEAGVTVRLLIRYHRDKPHYSSLDPNGPPISTWRIQKQISKLGLPYCRNDAITVPNHGRVQIEWYFEKGSTVPLSIAHKLHAEPNSLQEKELDEWFKEFHVWRITATCKEQGAPPVLLAILPPSHEYNSLRFHPALATRSWFNNSTSFKTPPTGPFSMKSHETDIGYQRYPAPTRAWGAKPTNEISADNPPEKIRLGPHSLSEIRGPDSNDSNSNSNRKRPRSLSSSRSPRSTTTTVVDVDTLKREDDKVSKFERTSKSPRKRSRWDLEKDQLTTPFPTKPFKRPRSQSPSSSSYDRLSHAERLPTGPRHMWNNDSRKSSDDSKRSESERHQDLRSRVDGASHSSSSLIHASRRSRSPLATGRSSSASVHASGRSRSPLAADRSLSSFARAPRRSRSPLSSLSASRSGHSGPVDNSSRETPSSSTITQSTSAIVVAANSVSRAGHQSGVVSSASVTSPACSLPISADKINDLLEKIRSSTELPPSSAPPRLLPASASPSSQPPAAEPLSWVTPRQSVTTRPSASTAVESVQQMSPPSTTTPVIPQYEQYGYLPYGYPLYAYPYPFPYPPHPYTQTQMQTQSAPAPVAMSNVPAVVPPASSSSSGHVTESIAKEKEKGGDSGIKKEPSDLDLKATLTTTTTTTMKPRTKSESDAKGGSSRMMQVRSELLQLKKEIRERAKREKVLLAELAQLNEKLKVDFVLGEVEDVGIGMGSFELGLGLDDEEDGLDRSSLSAVETELQSSLLILQAQLSSERNARRKADQDRRDAQSAKRHLEEKLKDAEYREERRMKDVEHAKRKSELELEHRLKEVEQRDERRLKDLEHAKSKLERELEQEKCNAEDRKREKRGLEDQLKDSEVARREADEQRRQMEAIVEDVKRECQAPFVVPALMDAFISVSRLTSQANGTSGAGTSGRAIHQSE